MTIATFDLRRPVPTAARRASRNPSSGKMIDLMKAFKSSVEKAKKEKEPA